MDCTKSMAITCTSIFLVCVIAVTIQVIFFSPMFESPLPSSISNSKLQRVIKLGEGILMQPEDVVIDQMGVLYTATRDGCIKRLHRNGTWDTWWQIDSNSLFGLTMTSNGYLVVCDTEKGLLKVGEDGVTNLAPLVRFADDVVESSDGTLYFSVGSSKYTLHEWQLDFLDTELHGQLLKYDPSSKETSILLENLGFANGVALSANQDYLVICETWKFRCLKYWLKGESKGETEIFIDNLPGGPDNINLAPDGSFWIALVEVIPRRLKFVHTSRASKYILNVIPGLSKYVVKLQKRAMVVNVDSEGNIVKGFGDPNGEVIAFVTSALEFEQHLYLGNLYGDFIGKLPLLD